MRGSAGDTAFQRDWTALGGVGHGVSAKTVGASCDKAERKWRFKKTAIGCEGN